jgi:hypothetical protein
VYWPRNAIVWFAVATVWFPVTSTSPASMLSSPSSAAWIAAAFALKAIGAVVWPSNVIVNVPPVAPRTRTVCDSLVFMSL